MTLEFDPIEAAARRWSETWGADSASPMSAVASVMRVHQILLARLNEQLARFDLTYARYEALMLLNFSPDGSLPIGRLSEQLQLHRTSTGALVDGLEDAGLVRRRGHPTDRRTTLACVTARGRDIAASATVALNEIRFGTTPLQRAELDSVVTMFRWVRVNAGDFEPS